MRVLFVLFLVISTSSIVVAAESHVQSQLLRIHGSNTVGANLAPELVTSWLSTKGYKIVSDKMTAKEERHISAMKSGNKLDVEIHAHGSSTSFIDFAAGKIDIGMSSRPIKEKEIQKLSALGNLDSQESEYVVALDGLPIIVHKNNPLAQLSKDTVMKIFSGQITNWSELGLAKGTINIYARDDKSGTYDTFKSLVLGKKTSLAKSAKRFESNAKLSDEVSNDPNGIGFVGLAYVRDAKVLAISDTDTRALIPGTFSVATEDYVLSRRLFMYIPEINVHPLAKEFVKYAASAAADNIVNKIGFVSQQISGYRVTIPEAAPLEYHQLTTGAVRLSLNVRFKSGSIKLDNKAVRDVERLVKYVQKNPNKKILLFGFSDKHEVIPYISDSFSVSRADAVADYLSKYHIHPVRVRGYGGQLPVSNNETRKGRYKNRRVEIWMM
ncbi:MAG: phosphate ABC transporter substrate-binding/OmpA family protein [Gammaproteobacteria bacterium]|nr:phosphate ABC transporter substrate-binding/OmpA family protein [Gammaproteobacteria bacterium]MCW9030649.1 phosphate ABC transporter substrate-binding/OmpA family protein [Gammaproteobacteria bacterium]